MSNPKILVADDEPHLARIVKVYLERAGYEVEIVINGEQALESILRQPPSILITDIDMPRMTGKELCLRIADEMPDRDFLIVVLTSRTEREHKEWSSAMTNVQFMEKPVSLRSLQAALAEYFSGAQTRGDQVRHG